MGGLGRYICLLPLLVLSSLPTCLGEDEDEVEASLAEAEDGHAKLRALERALYTGPEGGAGRGRGRVSPLSAQLANSSLMYELATAALGRWAGRAGRQLDRGGLEARLAARLGAGAGARPSCGEEDSCQAR